MRHTSKALHFYGASKTFLPLLFKNEKKHQNTAFSIMFIISLNIGEDKTIFQRILIFFNGHFVFLYRPV
jgi:hypothetical protein